MADGGERETLQLFDLTFKLILKEASSSALVQFINGLFGTDYPPDSKVVFHATESVNADTEKLEKLTSDMIITIAGDAFLIEAQISDDGNMALRVFRYSFAYAVQSRDTLEEEGTITLRMPVARILYWETSQKTPDKVALRLIFPDGSVHVYEVETFKVLDKSVEELSARNMALLFPFCLLKFRKAVKQADSAGRTQFAAEMKALLRDLDSQVEAGRASGVLSDGDVAMILERMVWMHEELYRRYSEFKEADMELRERLRTKWQDYLQEGLTRGMQLGRKEGRKEGIQLGRKEGIQLGEQKGEKRIIELLEQGCTLEEIKRRLGRESGCGDVL